MEGRRRTGDKVALQGNLDPATLSPRPTPSAAKSARCCKLRPLRHIFNLGHGITPDVQPDHLKVLVDAVHRPIPAAAHAGA